MTTLTHQSPSIGNWVATGLLIWAGAVVIAASSGALALVPPRGIAMLVAAGVAVPMMWYAFSVRLRSWIEQVGLRRLTLFHGWRIGAALLFFIYGAQGKLPPLFVERAATGDLVAGVLAVGVGMMAMRRWRYLAVHAFGMADFVTAVGTGLYFTLTDPAAMASIRELPLALIPMFGVGLSGATHLMAFDLMRRRAGGA